MTTHLRGGRTRFLPFNRGYNKGAGNPDNPKGFKTSYLWEDVWQKDSLLEIINHFLQVVEEEDDNGKKIGEKKLIFPRYHQLDAVRRLVSHAKTSGTGQYYLIQHSAGSGKSNTIAWLCHQLASLHDSKDKRVFDSILVITDRRILDRQLRQTVKSFEQVKGVVTTITEQKAKGLAEALGKGSDIIVITLQTFPFAVDLIGTSPGKRFAVVIDEAHSSQSGESAKALKEVLSTDDLEKAEAEESGAVQDDEDAVNAAVEEIMKKRGRLPNVSFFAFTATPKNKTLELFGAKQSDGSFRPFSLYSMRQAIEEKFILDVLENYTTYKVYFGLLKKIEADPLYDRTKGTYLLKSYADLHEHGIRKKTELMLEHFHLQVKDRINGSAKAMIVTRSRLHAVRFKQAFDKYLSERKYPYKALVAFSGTVRDPKSGNEYTEASMNSFSESQTAESFKKGEYRFLIVANKFQTGFDQPLLHTMYVDKKLGGVNAVQTLSRLNRTHPGKEDTFVLDFANNADEIRDAFQPYYETTLLSEATDPNKLYDIKGMLEKYSIYHKADIDAFASVYFSKKGKQEKLHAVLDPVVARYEERTRADKEDFRKHLGDYVRLYAFLSQLLTFTDTDLEKLYQFTRHLRRKLPVPPDDLPREITNNINMDSYRIQQTSTGEIKLISEDGELKPISDLGTGRPTEEELAPLSEIVTYINEHFGTEFTNEDKVRYFAEDMERRLVDKKGLSKALDSSINPSEENRRLAFDNFFKDALEDMIDANFEIYKKINDDPNLSALFRAMMFKKVSKALASEKNTVD
jgi:type I restriction enzyme R subunit